MPIAAHSTAPSNASRCGLANLSRRLRVVRSHARSDSAGSSAVSEITAVPHVDSTARVRRRVEGTSGELRRPSLPVDDRPAELLRAAARTREADDHVEIPDPAARPAAGVRRRPARAQRRRHGRASRSGEGSERRRGRDRRQQRTRAARSESSICSIERAPTPDILAYSLQSPRRRPSTRENCTIDMPRLGNRLKTAVLTVGPWHCPHPATQGGYPRRSHPRLGTPVAQFHTRCGSRIRSRSLALPEARGSTW
jgi:hypothetical protein